MNDTAWDRVVDAIDAKFGTTDHGRYTEALEDRTDLEQKVHFICFEREGQTYKIERTTGPAIVDRKSHYTKTAGADVRFENIYDPEEISHKVRLYRRQGEDWLELDQSDLSLLAG